MARIAAVHIGLTGHVGPVSRLSRLLSQLGHEVTAWAPPRHRSVVERDGVGFRENQALLPGAFEGGAVGFIAALTATAEEQAGALAQSMLEEEIDVVLHDCHAPWGRVAADFLGLPRIVSFPFYPPLPGGSGTAGESTKVPSAAVEKAEAQAMKAVLASHREIARRFGVDLAPWLEAPHSSNEITTVPSIAEVVGTDRLLPAWRLVGALLDAVPPIATTDEPPLVYVSLGTFFNHALDVYRAVIEGLQGEAVRVLISTGGGPVRAEDLGKLPPGVEVREYVDGRAVLARAALMVSHCGINSVHEALVAGVPTVCLPQALDQFAWADRIQALGAGIRVEADPQPIRDAVDQLLRDPEPRRRAAELGQSLLEFDASGQVAALIAEALDPAP